MSELTFGHLVAVREVGLDAALGERVARRDGRLQSDVVLLHVLRKRAISRQNSHGDASFRQHSRGKAPFDVSAVRRGANSVCPTRVGERVPRSDGRLQPDVVFLHVLPTRAISRQHWSAFVSIRVKKRCLVSALCEEVRVQ